MRHTDGYRLERIAETGALLLKLLEDEGIDRTQLLSDYRIQWQVTTPLYNIGEQVYCLSKDFKARHPEVPWSGIAGLRHRLVHDYEGTNWNIVASIVFDELPGFLDQVTILLEGEGNGEAPPATPGA